MALHALRRFVTLPPWAGLSGDAPIPDWRWWRAPACSYNNRVFGPIDTIVIHATAGSSSSGAMSVAQECKASWHWLIPDENEAAHGTHVWQCVDYTKKAWHVLRKVKFPIDGRTDINRRSIGIEVVNAQVGPSDPFSDWQYRVTAQIVNYCRAAIGPGRHWYLATHAYLDPNRKLDPGHVFDWEQFMGYVGAAVAAAELRVVWERNNGEYSVVPCAARLDEGQTVVNAPALLAGVGLPLTVTGRRHIREVLPADWVINGDHVKTQKKCYIFSPD